MTLQTVDFFFQFQKHHIYEYLRAGASYITVRYNTIVDRQAQTPPYALGVCGKAPALVQQVSESFMIDIDEFQWVK